MEEDKLPENLKIDIFSRLPIKSIITCKCVCKKWQSLVADPFFAHLHLHLARSRQEALMILECPDLQSPNVNPTTFLKWLEIDEHQHLDTIKSLNLKHCEPPIAAVSSLLFPIGSVNGLVSYLGDKNCSIYIFNPLLEQYMTLPPPPSGGGSVITLAFGFGVSITTGEYKVIRIVSKYLPSETAVWAVGIQVHTLGADRWRSLREVTPKKSLNLGGIEGHGVYLDGHLYWVAGHARIYGFDLSSEMAELFPAPGDNRDSNRMLGVLKGRLSCICWCSSEEGMEVWVRNEESANNWYKEITVIKPFIQLGMWRHKHLYVIDGLEQGGTSGVLLVYVQVAEAEEVAEKLVVYCLNTEKILSETPVSWSNCSSIMTYRPSFVKLDRFGSQRVRAMYGHSSQGCRGLEQRMLACLIGRYKHTYSDYTCLGLKET